MLYKTLIIIKPDATRREVHRDIVNELCAVEGLSIAASLYGTLSVDVVQNLYIAHLGASFYSELIEFMRSGPCFVVALEGRDAVYRCLLHCGTNIDPDKCEPETIRSKWGTAANANSIHRSANPRDAIREISIFFPTIDLSSNLKYIMHDES